MGRKEFDISPNEVVNYIINHNSSIRETAQHFGCSKDVIFSRIKKYDGSKKEQLEEVLQSNLKKSRF